MTPEEFKTEALNNIPEKPHERINNSVKELLSKKDLIIDVHAHIFDADSVPDPYLQSRIFEFFKKIGFTGKLEQLIEENVENRLNKRIKFLMFIAQKILSSILPLNSREKMLNYYRNKITKDFTNLIFISLMMDIEKGWNSPPKKSIPKQIEEVKILLKKNYPILPFLAVDPRKNNLYETFLKAFTGEFPFFGVKVYPALGFLPVDVRLHPIYEICIKKNIPVTTHCGGTLIAAVSKNVCNTYPETQQAFEEGKCNDYKERAAFFNHPKLWEPVLNEYPDLRLNFGHFGGMEDWQNLKKGIKAERIEKIISLITKKESNTLAYKNLYTDFSYNLKKKNKQISVLKKELDKNPLLREKVMFGTDYWVVNPLFPKRLKKEINFAFENITPYFNEFTKKNALNFLGLNSQ